MERLLIILAVLVCAAALVAVAAMSVRARRPPLRMDSEFDADDTDIIIGPLGPRGSPIDRAAPVLDAEPREAPRIEQGEAEPPQRRLPDAAR